MAKAPVKLGQRKKTFKCKYCKRAFSKEATLVSHMCAKKKRFADKDSIGPRVGFRVFQRYYELTTNSKKPKTLESFIDSRMYVDFAKFGRYIADLDPVNKDAFVDFIIKNGVKLRDWRTDYVYETYLEDLMRKEPPEKGLERTIVFLSKWAEENDCVFNDFFRKINPIEASFYIKAGRISPWVLYLAESADDLLAQFNDEQYGMIENIIDPSIWTKRITKNTDDTKFIKETLKVAGL